MPRPIIFCGPSGVGKSTMIKKLFSEFPKSFGLSCSHTSRLPRQGETDNIDYHFTGRQEFLELVEKGEFIEHAEFAGNLYGTSYSAVESVLNRGQNVVLDIDMQGVVQMKTQLKEKQLFKKKPLYLFFAPPSLEDLEQRLRKRGTETENALQCRLDAAKQEIEWGTSGQVDYVLINDNIDNTYSELVKILRNESII